MENYSAELNSLMSSGRLYAVKIMGFFPFLLLCFERDGTIFSFITVENVCSTKRDPLMFVAINSVMPESGSSIQPEPLYHGSGYLWGIC